jgi:Tol biopolymer transport system component
MAYTTRELGQLMLIDQHNRKQTVSGVKDALLPAWSTDGTRLAWVQKAGRKKYTLVWAVVSSRG